MIKRTGLILAVMFLILVSPAVAAKPRVWKSVPINNGGSGGTPSVTAKITGWKQYLGLSFRGVSSTNGINYELIFNGNDNEQGVYGSVKSREGNTSRSIFLGTCSHGACTAYRNINNLKLTITFKLKNGQDLVKRYKVKY
ncbi:MAG: hypothetical protein UU09_C0018G0005 [Microgenomates group bacterium GW2011_GWA2_40_6]|nr:MAG: hypothetical protein UU09_C0018G0005 [Microgenomates group bacterium GW2011_GWA2_40_6]